MSDLIELPFGFYGKVFRSLMPFGRYDTRQDMINQFKKMHIDVIVMLTDDEECLNRAGCDLRARYHQEGFQVVYLPIRDYDLPEHHEMEEAIRETFQHAQAGHNIAIHCYAGNGRTGTFAACAAKRAFGMSGRQAINWVRKYIPEAIETHEQELWVLNY